MKVAITGATGFLGHYIVDRMQAEGNECRCWYRSRERCYQPEHGSPVEWVAGALGDDHTVNELLDGCDAVVHSGLHRSGPAFRGGEGDIEDFVRRNVLGTVQLIEAARRLGVGRFVFVSTCAVHERILNDRPLDEAHPLWMTTHYGAHKAAIEQFVHSYGFGIGYPICALRPTGIYGCHHQPERSKWYDIVRRVVAGESVNCERGGKEVHAADVAECVELLLHADSIAGEAYSCCDRYVSEFEVAQLAREISGANGQVTGRVTTPKNQIVSDKIKDLGMKFGGDDRLRRTVRELVDAVST
jgi:nucleoside-diphosphate-sugar epimerase